MIGVLLQSNRTRHCVGAKGQQTEKESIIKAGTVHYERSVQLATGKTAQPVDTNTEQEDKRRAQSNCCTKDLRGVKDKKAWEERSKNRILAKSEPPPLKACGQYGAHLKWTNQDTRVIKCRALEEREETALSSKQGLLAAGGKF